MDANSSKQSSIPINKDRWGMVNTRTPTLHLVPGINGWDGLDHSQTLNLGFSGTTSIVFERKTFQPFIMRACDDNKLTTERKQLAEMAQDNKNSFLIRTCFMFKHGKRHVVGSALSDMSLSDIIDSTIQLEEVHLSSVLRQVWMRDL